MKNIKIEFYLKSAYNQDSAVDAGAMRITTYTQIDAKFFVVDQGLITQSFVAAAGQVRPSTIPMIFSDKELGKENATWTFGFRPDHEIPANGYLKVTMPKEIVMNPGKTMKNGYCAKIGCKWTWPQSNATEKYIIMLMLQRVPAGEHMIVDLAGITNPNTRRPTGQIVVSTFGTDGVSLIDTGFNQSATMTSPGQLDFFSAINAIKRNGITTQYRFTMESSIQVREGYRLDYELPAEVRAPVLKKGEKAKCKAILGFAEIECTVVDQKMEITLKKISKQKTKTGTGKFMWTVEGIRNPQSTKPSSSFVDITLYDENAVAVASYTKKTKPIINIYSSYISKFSLDQTSIDYSAVAKFTVIFKPNGAIPPTGSI